MPTRRDLADAVRTLATADPRWPNRDRFVVCNGHGSMRQCALLQLSGFALPTEQRMQFRQRHSKTAGHPEASDVTSCRASQMALDAFGPLLPELLGVSADLANPHLTPWKGSREATLGGSGSAGNDMRSGVRALGITAMANGVAPHGGFIPYDATCPALSDYARSAMRISALIPAHTIHVYTENPIDHDSIDHDSIDLGKDGAIHQPVEHLAALRYPRQLRVAPVRRGGVGAQLGPGD